MLIIYTQMFDEKLYEDLLQSMNLTEAHRQIKKLSNRCFVQGHIFRLVKNSHG
jgi:hypothetical protein